MKRPRPLRPAARKKLERQREHERKEQRESRLMLIAIVCGMILTTTAYFVFYAIPRISGSHRTHRHSTKTNIAGTNIPAERKP